MKKILSKPFAWVIVVVFLLGVNFISSRWHTRWDLTAEDRFTLSPASVKLLQNLEGPVDITVFLEGKMPAGFRKLSNSTEDLLRTYREISGNKVKYHFTYPLEGLDDSSSMQMMDSLARMGINPTNVKAQTKTGEEQQMVFPGMMVSYQDRTMGMDLLKGQSAEGGLNSLNTAEALLEYKLSSTLHKITLDSFPTIVYLVGNGQPDNYQIYDAINTIRTNYPMQVLDVDSIPFIPAQVNAVIINKPTTPFSEQQKLKIDQYIMHGGKVIWMLDALYASLDSLQRSEGSFIAFDRGLNLEDQLFKYGVRINQDLVQDLNCDKIPSVYGSMGGKPQIQLLPWPYFPLLGNGDAHPISKNLDYVLSQFPGSIDTVKAPGVRKTILLSTSSESRVLSTPAKVEWASVRNEEDMKTFTRKNVPVAVLLEGKFNSPFANRLSLAQADTLSKIYGRPFLSESATENQMIVISDGDIISNAVTQNEGPLMMGMNQYTQYQYANRDFFLNCLEFLTDKSGILETRSKDYALRVLDAKKVEEGRSRWQLMAIVLPMLLVLAMGLLWQWLRKRKYALRGA